MQSDKNILFYLFLRSRPSDAHRRRWLAVPGPNASKAPSSLLLTLPTSLLAEPCVRASSCSSVTGAHPPTPLQTALRYPATAVGASCRSSHNMSTGQDTEAAGKQDSLKIQTNPVFKNYHSAGIQPRLSQQLDARSLHPGIFSGISSISYKHQLFCSSKA